MNLTAQFMESLGRYLIAIDEGLRLEGTPHALPADTVSKLKQLHADVCTLMGKIYQLSIMRETAHDSERDFTNTVELQVDVVERQVKVLEAIEELTVLLSAESAIEELVEDLKRATEN